MIIDPKKCPYRLNSSLTVMLNLELQKLNHEPDSDVILNFRDPGYSAENGGFHPVEVMLRASGEIAYITDFAYVGGGPYAELAKEIDFDFSLGLFGHMGRDYPIEKGAELFQIWQENFVSYYEMGVFQVSAERV